MADETKTLVSLTDKDIAAVTDAVIDAMKNKTPNKFIAMFASRRFIMLVASVLVVLANKFNLGINTEQMIALVGALASWKISDGLRETK